MAQIMKIWFMDIVEFNNAFHVKEKQQCITQKIAFSYNKWSGLNLIIFFATESIGAFATRKKKKKISVCFN